MPDSQPGKMIFSNSQFFLLKRFSISQIFVCRFLIRSVESSLVENFQFLKNQMKILRHSDGWITRGSLYWNLRPVVALLNALNRPHFDYSSTPCATERIQKKRKIRAPLLNANHPSGRTRNIRFFQLVEIHLVKIKSPHFENLRYLEK